MNDEHTRRRFTQLTGIALGTAVAGCSGPTANASEADATTTTTTNDESNDDSGSSGSNEGGGFVKTDTVEMTAKLKFAPKRIQVSKGATVTWKNVGSIGHTVTAYGDKIPDDADYFASGGFDSEKAAREGYKNGQKGNIPKGETYEHTFDTKGEYKYFCIPHELNGMVGYVKVV